MRLSEEMDKVKFLWTESRVGDDVTMGILKIVKPTPK